MKKAIVFMGILAAFAILIFGMSFAPAGAREFGDNAGISGGLPGGNQQCAFEFKSYDLDSDGQLSRMEYETAYKEGAQARATVPSTTNTDPSLVFSKKDRANTGFLTMEEFCS